MHPLFTKDERIMDGRLLGVWASAQDTIEIVEVAETDEKTYTVVSGEEGAPTIEFFLGKIGERTFFDFFPNDDLGSSAYAYLRLHNFTRIWISTDTLRTAGLDSDWLRLVAEAGSLPYEKIDEDIVFTASTLALQAFFAKHFSDQDEALTNEQLFTRVDP